MIYKLTIPGRFCSLNDYVGASRTNAYKSASIKKKADKRVVLAAKEQLPGLRIKKPVKLHFTWFEMNKRRDLDNIAFAKKFIQDGLVSAEILTNDSVKEVIGFTDHFAIDKKNPRVEVEIEEIES